MISKGGRALLGVLLPPLLVLAERGCGGDFLINLILTILLIWIGGIIHVFSLLGVSLAKNFLAVLLPPVAVYLQVACHGDFWICVLLTLLGWIPGVIYAYYMIQ